MGSSDDRLEWSVNLGSQKPVKRMIVLSFALVAALIGLLLFNSPLMSVIGFLVVIASTLEYFIPLKYIIDGTGARVRSGLSVTAMEWSDVKRLIPMQDGVRLSPLDKPSRLDEFRGVYLRYAGNEEAVSAKIRQLWNGDTSSLGSGTDRTGDGGAGEQPSEPDSTEET